MSTPWSIGSMMSGIEPNPLPVGIHVTTAAGIVAGDLETANRDALTIALIVAPGTITEAKLCQINVSNVATVESSMALGDLSSTAPLYAACPDEIASAKT